MPPDGALALVELSWPKIVETNRLCGMPWPYAVVSDSKLNDTGCLRSRLLPSLCCSLSYRHFGVTELCCVGTAAAHHHRRKQKGLGKARGNDQCVCTKDQNVPYCGAQVSQEAGKVVVVTEDRSDVPLLVPRSTLAGETRLVKKGKLRDFGIILLTNAVLMIGSIQDRRYQLFTLSAITPFSTRTALPQLPQPALVYEPRGRMRLLFSQIKNTCCLLLRWEQRTKAHRRRSSCGRRSSWKAVS